MRALRGALLLLAASLAACGGDKSDETTTQAALTVELVSPARDAWPDELTASGEIAPWHEAIIGAEVSGLRLEEVLVDVGDRVRKGQLLARYNDATLRAELAQLDAVIVEARANLERARAETARAEELAKIGAMSQQALLLQQTQAQVAAAQLASAEAQRETQQLRLRYARVVAPDDGVIASRTASVGTVAVAGAELFRLVRQNRLEWRAEVPSDAFARLRPGTVATLIRPDGESVKGTLRQLAPTVNHSTRYGLAYVDLPADSGLAAGMYLTGRFTLAAREALTLPESAIVLRDGNHYLLRVDEQLRVHEVKVRTGRRRGGSIEVLEGVEAQGRYVKSGGAFVADGDLVRVAAEEQAP